MVMNMDIVLSIVMLMDLDMLAVLSVLRDTLTVGCGQCCKMGCLCVH